MEKKVFTEQMFGGGRNMQQSKERIYGISRLAIEVCVIGCFAAVWFLFYNQYVFDTYKLWGGCVTVVIFAIIYNALSKMYKAFKIGAYQIGETILSQIISFGIADLLMYIECVLIHNRYVSLIPGIITVAVQILVTAVWALCAKRYYIKHVRPTKTLLIYGHDDKESFKEKLLKKCPHIFQIEEEISDTLPKEEVRKVIDKYDTIMLFSVRGGFRTDIMEYCIRNGKGLYMTPRIADIMIGGFSKRHLIDTPMLKYDYSYQDTGRLITKRVMDLAVSLFGAIVLSPVLLITALAIKLEDAGPVFYKQERCTRDGKVFNILKFRSMIVDAEKAGARPCTSGDDRITKVGRFIRKVRIDELPQLFNVIKGDMSIVGPRPERVEHVRAYSNDLPEFSYRMRVKGGLTGYAQIYGKYNTTPYDKIRLDLMYIENQSLLLDIQMVLLTIKTIFIPESTEGFEKEKSRLMTEANRKYGKLGREKMVS